MKEAGVRDRVRMVLLVTLVLFAGIAAVTAAQFIRTEHTLDLEFRENTLWAATQSEQELLRFLDALARCALGDPAVTPEVVRERFDILWSRIDLFTQGELARLVANDSQLAVTTAPLKAAVERVDPLVQALPHGDPAAAAAIRAELDLFAPRLREITMASLAADRAERASLSGRYARSRYELAFVGLALLGVLLLLAGYLVLSERRANLSAAMARRAQLEADAARARLVEAIENISEGFVLYDSQDRLVLCNQKYAEFYAESVDLLKPGETFKTIIRRGAERGQYREAVGRIEAWVQERMARRRDLGPAFEQALGDGRWLMVSDRPTRDGGLVGIRTDITELKRRELELKGARERLAGQAQELARLASEADLARAALLDAIENLDEGFQPLRRRRPLGGVQRTIPRPAPFAGPEAAAGESLTERLFVPLRPAVPSVRPAISKPLCASARRAAGHKLCAVSRSSTTVAGCGSRIV